MGSSFGGLSIGVSAIMAQQRALDVTGHNISNVNTPGYSRQSVIHSSTLPTTVGRGRDNRLMQAGTGVSVQEIKQYRDEFLDRKLRKENNSLGYWEARKSGIEELESIFNDTSEEGLQSVMNNLWNSWSQLSKPSGGLTARALVKESAIAFIDTVKNLDYMLTNFRKHKDKEIQENVKTINTLAKNIAETNYKIKSVESSGAIANDFRDERERLIDDLSKLANIQIINDGRTVNIALEGRLLVSDTDYEQLVAIRDNAIDGYSEIRWKNTMDKIEISGGSIKSLIDTRDELVNGFRDRLNEFVIGVAAQINNLHVAGYGNKDNVNRLMFVVENDDTNGNVNISNISLHSEMVDVNNIAAATTLPPGNYEDNTNSLAISEIRNIDLFSEEKYEVLAVNRKYNCDEFYRNLIADLGIKGQEAHTSTESQKILVEQIEGRRQSLMSVSLDEEMSNLIRFEHSYNAAARVINAMDEMLDYIVNKIGLGGR